MSTEAAKVVIDAEDLASKKVEAAARAVEKNIKGIKEVGGKAKASTEFIGTLANTLGGTAFGSYAGQLAQLTERISAFSEVSKAGGAGAMAFKAGLAGVVAVLAFKVGTALGDVVFQTEKWRKELELAAETAEKLNSKLLESARASAASKTIEQLDADVAAKNSQIEAYRKSVAAVDDTWGGFFSKVSGDVRAINEQNKQQIKDAEALKEIFQEQAMELRKKAIEDAEALKLEQQKKAEAEVILELKRLESERAAEQKKVEEEAARVAQKRIDDAKRLEDIKQNEINRLKEQRIELEKGKEAAHAFRLEQQGLDEATAKRLAAEQSAIDRLRESKEAKDDVFGSQQIGTTAVQSRLLTRGPAEKGIDKIAKNTEKTVDWLQKLNDVVEKNNRTAALELEFVS